MSMQASRDSVLYVTFQLRELPFHMRSDVGVRIVATAMCKPFQEKTKLCPQRDNVIGIHARASCPALA